MLVKLLDGRNAGQVIEMPWDVGARLIERGGGIAVNGRLAEHATVPAVPSAPAVITRAPTPETPAAAPVVPSTAPPRTQEQPRKKR